MKRGEGVEREAGRLRVMALAAWLGLVMVDQWDWG